MKSFKLFNAFKDKRQEKFGEAIVGTIDEKVYKRRASTLLVINENN